MGSQTTYEPKTQSCFILCDCHNELLVLEYDHEYNIAELCIFSRPYHVYRMSFWQKMRYIWQVLVRGRPYTDQIVLNDKQLKDLKQFLNSV